MEDFDFDDEPTVPRHVLDEVERQLNSSVSVADGYVARARSLGYGVDAPRPTWIDRLEKELEETEVRP